MLTPSPSLPSPLALPSLVSLLGDVALSRNVLLHVDSCIGGFVLPFLAADAAVAAFDFRVPGVTSMSVDAHKYGFAAKGASVVLYANGHLRAHQFFARADWPGGLFVSPSLAGTRAGGPIAAAWAAMMTLGEAGYRRAVADMMTTTRRLRAAIDDIEELEVVGEPAMTIVALRAHTLNVFAVADRVEARGRFHLERNLDSIHLTIMPGHADTLDALVDDLRAAVAEVAAAPSTFAAQGSAAMYGSIARIPATSLVDAFLVKWMSAIYTF